MDELKRIAFGFGANKNGRIYSDELKKQLIKNYKPIPVHLADIDIGTVSELTMDADGNMIGVIDLKDLHNKKTTPEEANRIKMLSYIMNHGADIETIVDGKIIKKHKENGKTIIDEFRPERAAIISKPTKSKGKDNG